MLRPAADPGTLPRALGRIERNRRQTAAQPLSRLCYRTSSYLARPSHDLSTALRNDDSLCKRVKRNISGKKFCKHRPENEYPRAFKRPFVHSHPDLESPGKRQRAARSDTAHNRYRCRGTDSLHLARHELVVVIDVKHQQLAQSSGSLPLFRIKKRKIIQRQMADGTPFRI